jgi:hypothetical protein
MKLAPVDPSGEARGGYAGRGDQPGPRQSRGAQRCGDGGAVAQDDQRGGLIGHRPSQSGSGDFTGERAKALKSQRLLRSAARS